MLRFSRVGSTRTPVGLMVNASFGEATYLALGPMTDWSFVWSSSVLHGRPEIVLVDGREGMIGCLQRDRYRPFQGSIRPWRLFVEFPGEI